MNLIDEDIERIRTYLFDSSDINLAEQKMSFGAVENNEKTAWKDYGKCRHMKQGIIPYYFATPVQFRKCLESIWNTDDDVHEDLVSALAVGVFRQMQFVRKESEENVEIPSYIYNF